MPGERSGAGLEGVAGVEGRGSQALPPHPCCALQGQACRLPGKDDAQDFQGLLKALQVLVPCPEELPAAWAVLAAILQLGNICFSSSEVGARCGQGPVWTLGQRWLVCVVRAAMIRDTCGPPSGPPSCP